MYVVYINLQTRVTLSGVVSCITIDEQLKNTAQTMLKMGYHSLKLRMIDRLMLRLCFIIFMFKIIIVFLKTCLFMNIVKNQKENGLDLKVHFLKKMIS